MPLAEVWPHVVALAAGTAALAASAHAVLYKRDSRSVIGWVAVIWLAPLVGSLLYVLLGINRIRRRAQALRTPRPRAIPGPWPEEALPEEHRHLASLARLVDRTSGVPLTAGNRLAPLFNGEQAYPAMLEAIDTAKYSVTLSSYIFNHDPTGRRFVEALARAVQRGVKVRVLLDDIGARYSWPSIVPDLQQAKVTVARFLPPFLPIRFPYFNLRNHRKILVVDGKIGFTGGMNIQETAHFRFEPGASIQDLHCRVEGPAVSHLQRVFADDWEFATGERLEGEAWFPALLPAGDSLARGIRNGPEGDVDALHLTILGALACARKSVRIVTPYFLPDTALVNGLNVAALRGVEVDIVLPERNNLRLVQWASTALLWQVLGHGCRVWLSPPPFDHTKLMVVDGAWTLLGSSNWDPRSFRLNFEFDVECYDPTLAGTLGASVEAKIRSSRPLSLAQVDGRRLPVRLRDGVARLLTPYL